jgi:large subunit ribosomal protein L34e
MAQRVTLRTRKSYNTKSARNRVVKTPGGKLVVHNLKKIASRPKCGDCGTALPGVPALRPREYATLSKRQKTVNRAYGGSRCSTCVRTRVLRAFLVEEAKVGSLSSSSLTITSADPRFLHRACLSDRQEGCQGPGWPQVKRGARLLLSWKPTRPLPLPCALSSTVPPPFPPSG